MAALTLGKYEADSGDIHPIRMATERYNAAGTPPTGEINNDINVKVSKSDREFGIRPRGVRLVRTLGTAPDTFKRYSFLPVLTETAYSGAGFNKGAEVTVDGVAWTVAAKVAEDF